MEKPNFKIKSGSTELEKLMDGDSNAIAINEEKFRRSNYNGSLTRFNIRSGDKIFSVDHSTSNQYYLIKERYSINTDEEINGFNASNGIETWRSQKFKNRGLTNLILNDDKIIFGILKICYIHQLDAYRHDYRINKDKF